MKPNAKRSMLISVFLLLSALSLMIAPAYAATDTLVLLESAGGHIYMDFPSVIMFYPLGLPAGTWNVTSGTNHTFSAVPETGYTFVNFTVTDGATTQSTTLNPINFQVDTSFNITAYFEVIGGPIVNITFTADAGGIGFYDYGGIGLPTPVYTWSAAGVTHTFTASASPGYYFTNFTTNYNGVDGILLSNPIVLQPIYNFTIVAHFAPIPEATPTPSPTPSPGFDELTFRTDLTSILEMIIGALATFGGIVVLMRAPHAWILGIIFLVVGFFIQEIANPSLTGILAFFLEVIVYAVFLFNSGASQRSRSQK